MSWFSDIAGKAESLLTQLDQNAAVALNLDSNSNHHKRLEPLLEVKTDPSSRLGEQSHSIGYPLGMEIQKQDEIVREKVVNSPKRKQKKQSEEEQLMKFLNSESSVEASSGPPSRMAKGINKDVCFNNNERVSKNTSRTPSGHMTGTDEMSGMGNETETGIRTSLHSGPASVESSDQDLAIEDGHLSHSIPLQNGHTETNVGHSETNIGNIDKQVNSESKSKREAELLSDKSENGFLRNEINSLNQEITHSLSRTKAAEKEVRDLRQLLATEQKSARQQLEQHRIQEEKLQAKDLSRKEQLELLKQQMESGKQANAILQEQLSTVQMENERLLSECGTDNQTVMAFQIQVESLQQEMRQQTDDMERQRQELRSNELALSERIAMLEAERSSSINTLMETKRSKEALQNSVRDLQLALGASKEECAVSQKELAEYRGKAQRILQEKESLIEKLKSGDDPAIVEQEAVSQLEWRQIARERDLYREEAGNLSVQLSNARQEFRNLEQVLTGEQEAAARQLEQMGEQLDKEVSRREEMEVEVARKEEELRFMKEDVTRARNSHLTSLAERDAEITRFRNQLVAKNLSSSTHNNSELRLKQLTENLIQKQSLIEALVSEKNSLIFKIEYIEKSHQEEMSFRSRKFPPHNFGLDDESVERKPSFLQESPFDGVAARRAKRVYSEIDKLSMRVGVALRRYPVARIFVVVYMVLLHLWVFLILNTTTPDTGLLSKATDPARPPEPYQDK